jgi:hypothetical protein
MEIQHYIATVTVAVMLGAMSQAHATLSALQPEEQVVVRAVLDGSGPSHIIVRGRALVVVDPNEGLVRRYALDTDDRIVGPPTGCAMSRAFSPRFVQQGPTGLRLLGEELHPGPTPSNAMLPVLDLSDGALTAMKGLDPHTSPAKCGDVRVTATAIPVEAMAIKGGRFRVSPAAGERVPQAGAIEEGPDNGFEFYSARAIGRTDNLGTVIIRRELAPVSNGTVEVAIWVTLLRKGEPTSIELVDHRVDATMGLVALPKRGFDYVAAAGHSLYVLGAVCSRSFCLERFDLNKLPKGDGKGNNPVAWIDLTEGYELYPEDSPVAGPDLHIVTEAQTAESPRQKAWEKSLVSAVGKYAFNSWAYPPAARERPCAGGPDWCFVRLRDGVIVEATDSEPNDRVIHQDGDPADAKWIGPRHLIESGLSVESRPIEGVNGEVGEPYSFGGDTSATEFHAALTSPTPRPVGHIREQLSGVDRGHYPIGIDCSSFVGHIFGVSKPTAAWMSDPPAPDVARRVPNLLHARPGDVVVKDGHIVIFNRRVVSGANRFVEVFEAASRCGRVCRSVYDPDFFNGWTILRLKEMRGEKGEKGEASHTPPVVENPFWSELSPG